MKILGHIMWNVLKYAISYTMAMKNTFSRPHLWLYGKVNVKTTLVVMCYKRCLFFSILERRYVFFFNQKITTTTISIGFQLSIVEPWMPESIELSKAICQGWSCSDFHIVVSSKKIWKENGFLLYQCRREIDRESFFTLMDFFLSFLTKHIFQDALS